MSCGFEIEEESVSICLGFETSKLFCEEIFLGFSLFSLGVARRPEKEDLINLFRFLYLQLLMLES